MISNHQNTSPESNDEQEDINLTILPNYQKLMRNKKLIASFTIIGLFIGGLNLLTTKKTWKGEFQIVLQQGQGQGQGMPGMNFSDAKLAAFSALSSKPDSLKTEIGILESPSVLLNIFEFVKKQKIKNGENSYESVRFKDWKKNNLIIDLEKGTSILNLSYQDTQRDLILPVLNKISTTYQTYSGKKRLRNIELGVNYFEKTIAEYKNKSFQSFKNAQQFAFDQNLTLLPNNKEIDKDIPNRINVEEIIVKAANDINLIDEQLKNLNNLSASNQEQVLFFASSFPSITTDCGEYCLIDEINKLDNKLENKRISFKEDDIEIQKTKLKKKALINLLSERVKGLLIAQKELAKSKLKAAERPEGVIIKYKSLLNQSAKDAVTLDTLENEYRILLLEKARNEDPWELITTPTLLPYPVAPRKKSVMAYSLITGLFSGILAALILEKRKDLSFTIDEINSLNILPVLSELFINDKQSYEESINLLIAKFLKDLDTPLALLIVGDIESSFHKEIKNSLHENLANNEIVLTDDLKIGIQYPNIIILATLGITKNKQLKDLKKKFLNLKNNILGIIVINKNI